MKKINIEELKSIQLNMLEELHNFCVANDIKYSLAYGSLIGAIRHNGYIPWDDDIDIFMTRDEYDKFKSSFRHKYLVFSDYSINSNHMLSFGKLYDIRTVFEEPTAIKMITSVYLDIFIIDGLGNDYDKAVRHYKKLTFLNKAQIFKMVKLSKNRSLIRNMVLCLGKFFLLPISYRKLLEMTIRNKEKYNYKDSNYAGELSFGTYRRILPKSVYEKYILHKFENIDVYVIKEYDTYLKSIFGDYMQLPPESKRITHHAFKAYWKD